MFADAGSAPAHAAASDEAVDVASRSSATDDVPIYDVRHPTYLGAWEKSVPNVHEDIAIDDMDEPHLKRKHAILDAHPEIKDLYSIEWKTKYITVLLVSIQVATAYAFGSTNGWFYNAHWAWMVLASYLIGATITGMFGVVIHEASHNLAFKANFPNRILGLIANIGIVFPISASFRRYHLEHHTFQGVHGKDPDLPLDIEWKLVKGNRFLKFVWVFCFPFLYVFRGAAMMKTPQKWELVNWAWTVSTDLAIYTYCGPRGLMYMFLSLWFGYGIHPGAAHFIQEHYTFEDGQETMSYYGSGNLLFMNIGFHNEHHDFTKIPWSKLPEIRRIAPEFYNSLAYHTSWIKCIWDFIMKDYMGPQSRLGRSFDDHKSGRATIALARKAKRD
ncbi:fatty acid desaturase-domain-containing protein [Catenaria anguillulae PL171]|uniref:Fatty acid desaturase-domain-containing protein n=1 Tax=Catenaria anguillulae PL171 TaxID=765915 RepID=A0A1Y2HT71_9FUNG|nr:fatty acid desaturase-domain-containing protein [Catenaria anguillulae PL171]